MTGEARKLESAWPVILLVVVTAMIQKAPRQLLRVLSAALIRNVEQQCEQVHVSHRNH